MAGCSGYRQDEPTDDDDPCSACVKPVLRLHVFKALCCAASLLLPQGLSLGQSFIIYDNYHYENHYNSRVDTFS